MAETYAFTSKLIDTMTRQGNDVLVVWKTTGQSTLFKDVPEIVWNEWRTSESVGKFYHGAIKGVYETQKV